MSNRLIYNLATDVRLNGGSQDFLCFPDQKNEMKSQHVLWLVSKPNNECWSNILTKLCVVLYQYQDQQIIFHLIRYADIKGRITSPTLHWLHCRPPIFQSKISCVQLFQNFISSLKGWKIIEYFCIEKQFSISKKKIWCGGFEQQPPEFQLIPSNCPGASEQQATTLKVLMI